MVPFYVYNISSLQIISLVENQLNGTLPASIGFTLPNLQIHVSGGNEFSGKIPISFCNASQLQSLDLSVNNFFGSVPNNLGNLPDLYRMDLSNNNLGRGWDFLTSLTNCSKLEVVDLNTNQFRCFAQFYSQLVKPTHCIVFRIQRYIWSYSCIIRESCQLYYLGYAL